MKEHYSPEVDEPRVTMLPYKAHPYHANYVSRLERTEIRAPPDKPNRIYIDQSEFVELTQKVNWLVEEVQSIKQVLRELDGSPYERYPPRPTTSDDIHRSVLRSGPHSTPSRYNRPSLPDKTMRTKQYHLSERSNAEYEYEARVKMRMYPYETLSRSDHDSYYSSDSPVSTSSKPEHLYSVTECPMSHEPISMGAPLLVIPNDINIAETILLWQRGINDIPPIVNWSQDQKLRHQNKLLQWFRVYHMFKVECNGDIGHFISKYTDTNGKMMTTSYVASLCPDVSHSFEVFLHSNNQLIDTNEDVKNDMCTEKILMLPRKINGRKVSAKDVIRLWEHGMGDIPPIKTWTKAQKFKQQSKISRWKKIVDIFKYQCSSDMKKFEEIYTDAHGCLLPVAAITSKFETIYGDELNITSKLMTVTTAQDTEVKKRKRSHDDDDAFGANKIRPAREEKDALPEPPILIRSFPQTVASDAQNLQSRETSEKQQDGGRLETDTSPQKLIKQECVEEAFDGHSSSPSNSESDAEERRRDSELYILFEKTSIQDMITYWEQGSADFPPIRTWLPQQRVNQKELIDKIEKLYYLFNEVFKRDTDTLIKTCPPTTDDSVTTLDELLAKHKHILSERLSGDTTVTSGADSMTFDFSHHKTISQSTDTLYLLPRKINGRKVNAKDVLQLWYHGLNKIPAVKQWSPQQKAVQQSKISRWKKIVDLFEQEFDSDWERFEKQFSNNLGQLLPITAIIAKHEEEVRTMRGGVNMFQ